MYDRVDAVVRNLKPEIHYEVEEKKKAVTLTDEGARKVEQAFGIDNLNDPENSDLNHYVSCALRANFITLAPAFGATSLLFTPCT
jgi:preprotein translocase subunit SecA